MGKIRDWLASIAIEGAQWDVEEAEWELEAAQQKLREAKARRHK